MGLLKSIFKAKTLSKCKHAYDINLFRKLPFTKLLCSRESLPPPSQVSSNFDRENDLLFGPIRNTTITKDLGIPSHVVTNASFDVDIENNFLHFPVTNSVQSANNMDQLEKMKAVSLNSASVGKILNVTMPEDSKTALERWRKMKIAELGEEGFIEFQNALFRKGKNFHQAVFDVLTGAITLDNVDIQPENEGHWKSLQHVFHRISDPNSLEQAVIHPYLKYHGIVDCVCKLDDKLVVLDWKTSAKKKSTVNQLYDNPVQVSAYAGAINFDPSFQHEDLCKGAVIMAYESGSPADIFSFDCGTYWKIWVQRLSVFHRLQRI